jgi:hypothetical protein
VETSEVCSPAAVYTVQKACVSCRGEVACGVLVLLFGLIKVFV